MQVSVSEEFDSKSEVRKFLQGYKLRPPLIKGREVQSYISGYEVKLLGQGGGEPRAVTLHLLKY